MSNFPNDIDRFKAKLEKSSSSYLVKNEKFTLNTVGELYNLIHDNIDEEKEVIVKDKNGERVESLHLIKDVHKPWRYSLVMSDSILPGNYYVTYYTYGDEMNSADYNDLSSAIANTQEKVIELEKTVKEDNNSDFDSSDLVESINEIQKNKADKNHSHDKLHDHPNKEILDSTEESFTTAFKEIIERIGITNDGHLTIDGQRVVEIGDNSDNDNSEEATEDNQNEADESDVPVDSVQNDSHEDLPKEDSLIFHADFTDKVGTRERKMLDSKSDIEFTISDEVSSYGSDGFLDNKGILLKAGSPNINIAIPTNKKPLKQAIDFNEGVTFILCTYNPKGVHFRTEKSYDFCSRLGYDLSFQLPFVNTSNERLKLAAFGANIINLHTGETKQKQYVELENEINVIVTTIRKNGEIVCTLNGYGVRGKAPNFSNWENILQNDELQIFRNLTGLNVENAKVASFSIYANEFTDDEIWNK